MAGVEPPAELIGDGAIMTDTVAALDDGVPGSFAFCGSKSPHSAPELVAEARASVIVLGIRLPAEDGRCFILATDPVRCFVTILRRLVDTGQNANQIHPTATIGQDVRLGKNVGIGAYTVVSDDVSIGDDTVIGSGAFIDSGTIIGARCIVGAHTSIGASGQGSARDGRTAPLHFPHLGRVIIGDEVEFGAQCVIGRGILKDTIVEDWTKVGNLVNIGHNCHLEKNSWVAARAVLCGSVRLKPNAIIGAGASINNHTVVGANAAVGLGSVVTKNVPPGTRVFGVPAKPIGTMRRFA